MKSVAISLSGIILLGVMSVSCTSAGQKSDIRNIDSGESCEISVPGNLKTGAPEHNIQMPDSISELFEHARWHEPWAFEALADYYRYGKGNAGKNIFNAIIYYEAAGRLAREIADEAYKSNPADELGLMNHLLEDLDKKRISEDDALHFIDGLTTPKPGWLAFLADILRKKQDVREEFIKSQLTPEASSDEFFIGCCFLSMADSKAFDRLFINTTEEDIDRIRLFGEKLPPIYDLVADKMWAEYEENKEKNKIHRSVALECMHHADQMGFLSRGNMMRELAGSEDPDIGIHTLFTDDDLERFRALCFSE